MSPYQPQSFSVSIKSWRLYVAYDSVTRDEYNPSSFAHPANALPLTCGLRRTQHHPVWATEMGQEGNAI